MSSAHVYILRCDAAGCRSEFVGVKLAGETRRMAAERGWRSIVVPPENRHGPYVITDFCGFSHPETM